MPRFRFIVTFLIVCVGAMIRTLADATPPPAAPRQVVDRRILWFEQQRIERENLSALGFVVLVEQRGLVLVEHDSGHCFLAPAFTAAYLETDPDLCVDARKRNAARRSHDDLSHLMMVPQ